MKTLTEIIVEVAEQELIGITEELSSSKDGRERIGIRLSTAIKERLRQEKISRDHIFEDVISITDKLEKRNNKRFLEKIKQDLGLVTYKIVLINDFLSSILNYNTTSIDTLIQDLECIEEMSEILEEVRHDMLGNTIIDSLFVICQQMVEFVYGFKECMDDANKSHNHTEIFQEACELSYIKDIEYTCKDFKYTYSEVVSEINKWLQNLHVECDVVNLLEGLCLFSE